MSEISGKMRNMDEILAEAGNRHMSGLSQQPGEFPYLHGIYRTMYTGRLWTMRQFAGFGSAQETNERFRMLLANGQTGLSVAFDNATLNGYDSDHPMSLGEVGKVGVAIDTLEDMKILFRDIPLDRVTTSMTINGPAIMLLAMYLAVAEGQGVPFDKVGGTLQNDILKEHISQKNHIFPLKHSMRLIVDIMEFCSESVPKWNTISISGYHIREAGATAVQELAFTIANGLTYVQAGLDRGIPIDKFAPRLSFFFNLHNDIFVEAAKIRAARRMWAVKMKELGATDPKSMMLRTHVQTSGVSLPAQQPLVNAIRVAFQALTGAAAGVQSMHTNSYDEALCLPTEEAVTLALRTQQVLAYESGITNVPDPLAGSHYVEALTDLIEEEAGKLIKRIDALGGMLKVVEEKFAEKEIVDSSFRYQEEVEKEKRIIVGVNKYQDEEAGTNIKLHESDPAEVAKQLKKLRAFKNKRLKRPLKKARQRLVTGACNGDNLVPLLIEAFKAGATLGETVGDLIGVFGEDRPK